MKTLVVDCPGAGDLKAKITVRLSRIKAGMSCKVMQESLVRLRLLVPDQLETEIKSMLCEGVLGSPGRAEGPEQDSFAGRKTCGW